MDHTDFDDAFNDSFFNNDQCFMIRADTIEDDTVLYVASAKIVDTDKADHEHLGHIPLIQLRNMIQENLISLYGSSNKAQLLSTFNQIKAAIAKGFFCPTCAIVKNSRHSPLPRVYPKATVYGGLIFTGIWAVRSSWPH